MALPPGRQCLGNWPLHWPLQRGLALRGNCQRGLHCVMLRGQWGAVTAAACYFHCHSYHWSKLGGCLCRCSAGRLPLVLPQACASASVGSCSVAVGGLPRTLVTLS